MENAVTLKRKMRVDCKHLAPCGKVSHSSCKRYKGRLEICAGCTLVRRYGERGGTMVNGVLMRRCCICGELRPAHRFYPKTIHHPNGKTYYTRDSLCDICKTRKAREYREMKSRASPPFMQEKENKMSNYKS